MTHYRGTHYRTSRLRRALITGRHFIRDHGPCILAAAIGGAIAFFAIAAILVPHLRAGGH
jgi:hypothetical protein